MNTQGQFKRQLSGQFKNSTLKDKLTQFGLDPREWRISEHASNLWLIQNSRQRDLTFIGRAVRTQQAWDWKFIELR